MVVGSDSRQNFGLLLSDEAADVQSDAGIATSIEASQSLPIMLILLMSFILPGDFAFDL